MRAALALPWRLFLWNLSNRHYQRSSLKRVDATVAETGAASGIVTDVTDEASIEELFLEVTAAGNLDGVFNNAGIVEPLAGTRRQSKLALGHCGARVSWREAA